MVQLEQAHEEVQDAAGGTPERTCAVTRAKLSPAELIRFVRAPDGTITPDLAHRLPGRGVWVTLDRAVVETAAARNVFARSLKRAVVVPDDLAGLVERLLSVRCTQALALANKAGLVVAGFAKVEAQIATGKVAALLHAADASRDGAAKLDGRLRARAHLEALVEAAEETDSPHADSGRLPSGEPLRATNPSHARSGRLPSGESLRATNTAEIIIDLTIQELSLALGRENVVHAAVIKGGAARYFLTEIQRLRRYRSRHPEPQAGRPESSSTEQV
ncbi:MAG: RNA-binding protein [Hyphomicrobiaceae bacterium]